MAKIVLQSQDGIISRLRKSLNSMFTELYGKVVSGTGDLITKSLTITGNDAWTLQDTVFDDLFISTGLFKFAGVSDPVWRGWQPGGSGATFQVMTFDKDDEIFFSCQMPHTYKEGSEIRAHIHWTPRDRGNEEDGNYVGWKLDYSIANINGDPFQASATLDMSDTCSGVDDYHEVSAALTHIPGTYGVSGADLTVSHMIMCRLYRSDTGTDDTWVGTGTQSPAILQFDFHHEIDTAGSRTEWVK